MSTEDPVRPEVPAAGAPERSAPTLDERLAAVPNAPGVYLLKDAHGKVIYVGKAVSLRGARALATSAAATSAARCASWSASSPTSRRW